MTFNRGIPSDRNLMGFSRLNTAGETYATVDIFDLTPVCSCVS